MPEQVPAFFERQQSLYTAIARELIGLVPDGWRRIVLTVSADERDGVQTMTHQISSPEGRREPILPSQELFILTRQLFLLWQEFGQQPWRQAIYEANLNPDESWAFKCSFDYA